MALPESQLGCTVEEYLARERQSEERHEFLDGVMYAMAGESPEHGIITVNLVAGLHSRLSGGPCQTFSKDTKVLCGPFPLTPKSTKGLFAYPDVVIVCGERRYHDDHRDVLLNPTVIVEVLSETTKNYDRGEKFERYRTCLSSLAEYVLAHQTQPRIEHYQKQATGQWLLTTIDGLESTLDLPALAVSLILREVYQGIAFAEPDKSVTES